MARIFGSVRCGLCAEHVIWISQEDSFKNRLRIAYQHGLSSLWQGHYRNSPPHRRWFILMGWTRIFSPPVWLCPSCAGEPQVGRRLAMLALSPPRASHLAPHPISFPKSYVVLHALAVAWRWLRKGWV